MRPSDPVSRRGDAPIRSLQTVQISSGYSARFGPHVIAMAQCRDHGHRRNLSAELTRRTKQTTTKYSQKYTGKFTENIQKKNTESLYVIRYIFSADRKYPYILTASEEYSGILGREHR